MPPFSSGSGVRNALAAAALLLLLPGLTPAAHAQVLIEFLESGGNVTATMSGSLDLTGLTLGGTATGIGQVRGNRGYTTIGPTTNYSDNYYSGITGATVWGPGTSVVNASSHSGDSFAISSAYGPLGGAGAVFVLAGYASGTPLVGTNTYTNQTFASLGLTPGTYNYIKTSNGTLAVTVTVVPEPSPLALLGTGLLPLGSLLLRKRQRKV